MLIQETKGDANFRKDLTEAIHQSNETFATAIQHMNSSVLQVPQGMTRSMEMLNEAMLISNNRSHTRFQNFPQQTHFPIYQQYHYNTNTLNQDSLHQQMASGSSLIPKSNSHTLGDREREEHEKIILYNRCQTYLTIRFFFFRLTM